MSTPTTTRAFPAGDFISQDAVRGVLRRRRRAAVATPIVADDRPAARTPADEAPPSERRTRPLRRWSVAELIARGFAQPTDRRLTH
jgi:hypothetical protein